MTRGPHHGRRDRAEPLARPTRATSREVWLAAMPDEPRTYANTSCPYCSIELDPPPKAKRRCPGCGEPIYARMGPDGFTYLLQVADLPELDRIWAEHREAGLYRAKVAALGIDFDALEAEMQARDARHTARDVWWEAVSEHLLGALASADWFSAQVGYFDRARDLADHGQPWAEVARAGFRMELRHYLADVDAVDVLACRCRVCQVDAGRRLLIAAELPAPRLPHADCEEGWCTCDYLPSFA